MALSKGLQFARQNRFYTVVEAGFMIPDPAAPTLVRRDVGSDGNGLNEGQQWNQFMVDGDNLVDSAALVGKEGSVTRSFMPTYRLMENIWRGVAGLPTTDILIEGGTRREITWIDPEQGSPAIETVTGYYGTPDGAARLLGGKIRSFNIDVSRGENGGQVTGNIEYHFNAVDRGVFIPNASSMNALYRFSAQRAVGGATFMVGAYTMTPTGKRQVITFSGAGPVTIGGLTVDITTPESVATFLGRLKTAFPARSTLTATGTITAAVAGTTDSFTASGFSDGNANGNYTKNAALKNGQPYFLESGGGISGGIYWSGSRWWWGHGDPSNNFQDIGGGTNANTPLAGWPAGVVFSNVVGSGGTPASVNITLTDNPSAGAQADFVVSSNATSTSTPYSSGGGFAYQNVTLAKTDTAAQIKAKFEAAGLTTVMVTGAATDTTFTVEVLNPSNTRVDVQKVSGIGWSYSCRRLGGVEALVYSTGPRLLPNHWKSYVAINNADLASINMDDVPELTGQLGDAHLLETATSDNFGIADLWKGHYTGTGLLNARDFVSGARTFTGQITVPNNEADGSDCKFLYDLENGCSSPGFWRRRVFSCGGFEYIEDVYWGRNEQPGYDVTNDVWMRSFPLSRRRNPEGGGSVKITLRLPVV